MMTLTIDGASNYPIHINNYHRNFLKSQTFAGTVNFELSANTALESTIEFLQHLYGQNKLIKSIQVTNDKGRPIALLYFENGHVERLVDSIDNSGKRTVLLTISFNSAEPLILST